MTHPLPASLISQLQLCASISPALRVWAVDTGQKKSLALWTLSSNRERKSRGQAASALGRDPSKDRVCAQEKEA